MRSLYAKKHARFIESIKQYMGDRVRITGKGAGTHMLLEVYTDRTVEELSQLAERAGIKVQSTKQYWMSPVDGVFPQFLLGFGGVPLDDISEGIRLLSRAWFAQEERGEQTSHPSG